MSAEVLVFTLDPDALPLWLPQSLADLIGAEHGQRLTAEQWNHREVQRLLAARGARPGLRLERGGA